MAKRAAANEVLPGKLYQRGQILTWSLSVKERLIREHGVNLVINFWAKVDPDMSNVVEGYLHFPVAPAKEMVHERISMLADYVVNRIGQGDCALVLCEAGVTRSVYFTVLLARGVLGVDGKEAEMFVSEKLGRVKMRPEMLEHIRTLEAPGKKPEISTQEADEIRQSLLDY